MSYRIRKRGGTISYGFYNPDGSWFEVPAPDTQPLAAPVAQAARPIPIPQEKGLVDRPPDSIQQFLRDIGKRGGQARAARHSHAEIAAWGRVRHKARAGA